MQGERHDAEHHGYLLITVEGLRATISWKAKVRENGAAAWKVLDTFAYSRLDKTETGGF
ncbi:MAG TPA: hypothetical protein VMG30_16315 [Acidobacteriota bacterium]|nr:hypothetical protein [Acidobacteriota bacterium]